jgi:hypothetical protein
MLDSVDPGPPVGIGAVPGQTVLVQCRHQHRQPRLVTAAHQLGEVGGVPAAGDQRVDQLHDEEAQHVVDDARRRTDLPQQRPAPPRQLVGVDRANRQSAKRLLHVLDGDRTGLLSRALPAVVGPRDRPNWLTRLIRLAL